MMKPRNNQEVKLRIPFPWTGWYYSINRDEVLPGRLWLCFTWWKSHRSAFVGAAVIAYFPAAKA